MALKKYKIVDEKTASTVHTFVMGQTKYINENLSDEEAEILFNNGSQFIALNESFIPQNVEEPTILKNLLFPKN